MGSPPWSPGPYESHQPCMLLPAAGGGVGLSVKRCCWDANWIHWRSRPRVSTYRVSMSQVSRAQRRLVGVQGGSVW